MASSLSSLPPTKTSSLPPTTITHFPSNPKTLILQQCKTLKDLTQIHAHLIKTQLILSPEIAENLLEAAAIILPNSMSYAVSIFDNIEKPVSPFFNIMIRGYTSKQNPEKGVIFFKKMCEESVSPDGFTFPCVLKACAKIRGLREGEQIHGLVIKNGFSSVGFVDNSLIYMYANCGCVEVSRRVFDEMGKKDVVTWNAIFSGYAKSGEWGKVLDLFNEMVNLGVGFDQVTLVCVLTACGRLGDLKLGEWIYNYVEENGLEKNLALVTSLVDMYAKCGRIEKARELFDRMGKRDVVAWSAMISGYNQARRCKEALELFNEMKIAKVEPNEVTMVSVFSSCAVLGALETGKWAHSYVKKRKMRLTITLGTSLIDFYAKCGCVETAIEVFHKMPMRNVLSWTVLIQCLASNGQGRKAIKFFNLMLEKNIKPNDVTFLGVLCACSHAGLVDEGRRFFVIMSRDYGIEPRIEHFGCMVDILGRAGLIEEAYQFVKNMPLKPNAVIWRTLLAACKVHKNVKIGEESFKNVMRMESTHSGDYILLSNIYASVGRWDDAVKVRNEMKIKGIKKSPGCCEIELDGVIYEFLAEDNANPLSKEVYIALEDMITKIKIAGYVPNTTEARLDADEDDKEVSVSHHSEKLAIAFGLIRTAPGTTIRISKNLRVCTDCHNATKMISKVFDREIVVRDRSRFHHFKDGSCSCNDYW